MRSPQSLINAIANNDPTFTSADFSNMTMDDDAFKNLISAIAQNTSIDSLSLLESGIMEHHIAPLHRALCANTTITDFQIQAYADYSKDSLDLIHAMREHVQDNYMNHRNTLGSF